MQYTENYGINFAEGGDRAPITDEMWEQGWREIVGGVNGYPTSAQFNEVCGRLDRKINEVKKKKPDSDGEAKDFTVTFDTAKNRENINSGESFSTIFGKIKKWFNDLGAAAFLKVAGNDTTNRSDTLPTTQVTYQHGQEIDQLDGRLTANGNKFYFDFKNGKYGYNTDPGRGADTFSPFREEIILGERLIRSGLTATTTINMADYCEDISKVTIDNFLFTITNINAYCWSWGHPSDTHGPDTNNNFSPVTGSYDSISGILTVTISAPTYGSGEYGQTGGGSCRITPTVNVYFLGDKK